MTNAFDLYTGALGAESWNEMSLPSIMLGMVIGLALTVIAEHWK
jgi:hypothetical protein